MARSVTVSQAALSPGRLGSSNGRRLSEEAFTNKLVPYRGGRVSDVWCGSQPIDNADDRNDARGLTDLVRMGWYREARVRSFDAQLVRSVLPSRRESEWIGVIGKTNDPLLRGYLYEAAGVLMTRVHRSCPPKMRAIRLAKRIGWKRASVAVARKFAIIVWPS
jgi:hypothetical protein